MKTTPPTPPRRQRRSRGYALLVTLMFVALAATLLMSLMSWTAQSERMTDRNNEYNTSLGAAEAASELALSHLTRDYLLSGQSGVMNNLASYQSLKPSSTENAYWNNYSFKNASTGSDGVYVVKSTNWQYTIMDGQYHDLYGYQSTFRIVANATSKIGLNNVAAAVQQDVGLQGIPIFQFAMFYNMDMEINPSPDMVVSGRVHANGNIYTLPSSSLTFKSDVTASGYITNVYKAGDPLTNRGIVGLPNVNYGGDHDDHVSSLNLPIGTNATSDNVKQILEVPPANESVTSALGACRLYNKADMLVVISDSGVKVTSGVPEGTNVIIGTNVWQTFMTTTNIIYDKRESSYVRATQFDVGKFRTWAEATNNPITPVLPAKTTINSVYIADQRTPSATIVTYTTNNQGRGNNTVTSTSTVVSVEPGVELINGSRLPKGGLTVMTPAPAYIRGDYNTTSDGTHYSKGSDDTTYSLPAAIMADAIMVLSTAWTDAESGNPLSDRVAADTTVNAAFLGGIVPTANGYYSGGVENFPRFLEDWTDKTFCYNGSMVVMFKSTIAKAPWGSNDDTYSPPDRLWAFDKNYYTETKIPPATPQILFIERLGWQSRKAGTTP